MKPSTPAAIARPDLIVVERATRRRVVIDVHVVAVVAYVLLLLPPGLVLIVLAHLWRSL